MTRRSVLTTFTSLAVAALGRRRAFAAPAALGAPRRRVRAEGRLRSGADRQVDDRRRPGVCGMNV
jgi:hypothetical protein